MLLQHRHKLVLGLLIILGCRSIERDPIENLKADVFFLASDSLKGRETGSEGEKIAAQYLADQFEKIGLKPAGTDGYFQEFFVKSAQNPHELPEMTASGDLAGITGTNVMGMIDTPGDEFVVIGAHYDHLGMGSFSSLYKGDPVIHNGADDNASGTAVMLQLARNLSKKELNRDILFFGISGEEKGLWGSNYFVKNPTKDLTKANCMINLDMVGRLDSLRGLAISGSGTSPGWSEMLDVANIDSLKLILKESGVGPSDHTSFYLQDIPVLHFFTGQHEDYHKPTDDADKINYRGMLTIVNLIERLVLDLDDEVKLTFTKTKDESESAPRFTVTLGVVPDYLFDGKGMRIDGVSEGKPAHRAGIQKGDIVIQMGDNLVTDMISYMRALSAFEQDDETSVVINRSGEEIILEVQF